MFCPECSQQNAEDSKFCQNCGKALNKNQTPIIKNSRRRVVLILIIVSLIISIIILLFHGFSVQDRMSKEIITKTKKEIESRLLFCNGSWYGYGASRILEMKGISLEVKPNEITKADRANGIDWKGQILVEADLYREYDGKKWREWKEGRLFKNFIGASQGGVPLFISVLDLFYYHGLYYFELTIQNGQWQWDRHLIDAKKPNFDCNNIPK
jgi:predicted nucleic acid-binding Zn ribbon protein